VGYFDWHAQPGYFRDLTRHFDARAEILDVGCGSAWLADHFERYTGLDSSPEAVAAASQRGRSVIQADATGELPFPDRNFDGVVLKDVLEHLDDPVALVRESRRVLRPGGLVFASSPDAQRWVWNDYTHRRPFTRRSFRLLFADHGLDVERVGYESVMPGVGLISARTRRKRRPRVFAVLAWLPFHRRNVWLVARRPHDPLPTSWPPTG
jgi:SAM-dependent methyltransferase